MKKTVLVINPKSIDIMKAIYNILVINALDIIILGFRQQIQVLCEMVNLDINLLQIIDCNNEEEIIKSYVKYKSVKEINGIIVDGINKDILYKKIKCNEVCTLVDYGMFKKSCFIVNNTLDKNFSNNIMETIILLKSFINKINIGFVCLDNNQASMKKKWLKEEFGIKKMCCLKVNKIKKCKCNMIIFDDQLMEKEYINKIKKSICIKATEINKASNIIIFDANGKVFKNIFMQFMFLSKTALLNN